MAIITLSSDHGNEMWMHAPLKAAIATALPGSSPVDFFHDSNPYQIQRSAYRMLMSLDDFPAGSMHLVLNSVHKYSRNLVVARVKEQYFIGADTGYYSLIGATHENCKVSEIAESVSGSICSLLSSLSEKKDDFFTSLKPAPDLLIRNFTTPFVRENELNGEVLFTDHFGNAVLNIHQRDIQNFSPDSAYRIVLNRFESIDSISSEFTDKEPGEMLAKFNTAGYLMLSITNGNASSLLNLHEGRAIRISKQ